MQAIKSVLPDIKASSDNIERIQIVKSLDILKKVFMNIPSYFQNLFHGNNMSTRDSLCLSG